jgi:hypothetical protein
MKLPENALFFCLIFRGTLKVFVNSRPAGESNVGVPISYQYSSNRLLYAAIDGTFKNTIGGTQWENF